MRLPCIDTELLNDMTYFVVALRGRRVTEPDEDCPIWSILLGLRHPPSPYSIKIKGNYASDVTLESSDGYVVRHDQRAFSPTKNTLSNALAMKKQGVFSNSNPMVQHSENLSSLTCDY